jgi:hypothetical protein
VSAKYLARPIVAGLPVNGDGGQIKARSLTALLAAVANQGTVPEYQLYKVTQYGELVSLGKGASVRRRGQHGKPSRQR